MLSGKAAVFSLVLLLCQFPASKACTLQNNVDYQGKVIKKFDFSESAQDCCLKCQKTPGCKVFVWIPPFPAEEIKDREFNCLLQTGLGQPQWYQRNGPVTGFIGNAPRAIESNRLTNYGTWGDWEICPPGTFVMGFQLKVQETQFENDDTALNAIKLYCAPAGWKTLSGQTVSSKQGSYGYWRANHLCNDGIMTAFRLRSQPPQGGGEKNDDTAANNLEMRCNSVDPHKQFLKGDGMEHGIWQPWKECPLGQAIAAIRTQVQEGQGQEMDFDDTSLNNVQMMCCDVMDYTCRAEDRWVDIWRYTNYASTETTVKHSQTIGFQWPKSTGFTGFGKHWTWANGVKLGVSVAEAAKGFSQSVSGETKTGYEWGNRFSPAWAKSTTREVSCIVSEEWSVKVKQALAMCDGMVVARAPPTACPPKKH